MRADPRHYVTRALEDMKRLHRVLEGHPDGAQDKRYLSAIEDLLKTSVKFVLPHGGHLIDRGLEVEQHHLDVLKLPYKSVVLEFSCEAKTDGLERDEAPCDKRIIAAMEGTYKEEEGILVAALFYNATDKWWSVQGIHYFIPYGQTITYTRREDISSVTSKLLKEDGYVFDGKLKSLKIRPIIGIKRAVTTLMKRYKMTSDQVIDRLCYEAHEDWRILIEFCNILNCSNVEVETIPAPAKLNKKRESSGKPLMYEYKVLTIAPGKSHIRLPSGETTEQRNSPRQHLRRGHIRRYQTGHSIWITSTMVGDPSRGRIEKDYEVRTA